MHAIFGISDVLDTHRDNEKHYQTDRIYMFIVSLCHISDREYLLEYLVRTIANTSHALLVGSVPIG